MSRGVFGAPPRVNPRTLERWEQGRASRTPAVALLLLVRRFPRHSTPRATRREGRPRHRDAYFALTGLIQTRPRRRRARHVTERGAEACGASGSAKPLKSSASACAVSGTRAAGRCEALKSLASADAIAGRGCHRLGGLCSCHELCAHRPDRFAAAVTRTAIVPNTLHPPSCRGTIEPPSAALIERAMRLRQRLSCHTHSRLFVFPVSTDAITRIGTSLGFLIITSSDPAASVSAAFGMTSSKPAPKNAGRRCG